ncbi:MAG TPA: hypothetical protein VH951_04515, partial [Dehalococcoidia bacterium]
MRCHICNEPSVGQCTACFKFYCRDHGDGRCQTCVEEGRPAERGGFGRVATNSISTNLKGQVGYTGSGQLDRATWQRYHLKADQLRRVVPIVRSCQLADGKVTFASLEVYEDGAILRYSATGTSIADNLERMNDLASSAGRDPEKLRAFFSSAISGLDVSI